MDMHSGYEMTINGQGVQGANNASFEVINPVTGETFASAPECSREQLDEAVESARAAFPAWKNTPIEELSLIHI